MAREIKKLAEIPTLYEKYGVCKGVLDRISLWKGDITRIEIDAIVNAANSGLRGGGGVDGAIHSAAGYSELQRECSKIGHCSVGEAVITSACNLTHVKKIIHTVGPQALYDEADDRETKQLKSCYTNSLKLAAENDLTSIAFCCISTGVYGFPNDEAAYAAGNSIINFLKHHEDGNKIEKVVLCIFMPIDEKYYNEYFDRLADKYKGVK